MDWRWSYFPKFRQPRNRVDRIGSGMDTILHTESLALAHLSSSAKSSLCHRRTCFPLSNRCRRSCAAVSTTSDGGNTGLHRSASACVMSDSVLPKNGVYIVGDYMTTKEDLHVVKTTTTVEEALEALVENRITGFPVIDDNWKLVGLVSDYDLLALDSISGHARNENSMFPEANSTWKTFNEVQKLLNKTNGKVVGDLMTPAPLVVRENSNLEDAARLLLKTKYRRLPVVDGDGKLVGIITRGNVVRAALKVKRATEMKAQQDQ